MSEIRKYGVATVATILKDKKDRAERSRKILQLYRWFVNTFNAHPELVLVGLPRLRKKTIIGEGVRYELLWKAKEVTKNA